MSKTFRVYLLHLNDSHSCHGQARTSEIATFGMYLLHLVAPRSVFRSHGVCFRRPGVLKGVSLEFLRKV